MTAPLTDSDVSWNTFRYVADFLHLFGVLCVLAALAVNRTCKGLSLKTQVLYLVIFVTRYLDLLHYSQQPVYLIVFKLTFISTSVFIVYCMSVPLKPTVEQNKDTVNISVILACCALFALISTTSSTLIRTLWTYSEWLEAFAMVPQYVFCYRESLKPPSPTPFVPWFVLSVGGYRVFYALNWMYKRFMLGVSYSDRNSWIGGTIEILLFADFVAHRLFGFHSKLQAAMLGIDDKVNEIGGVELETIDEETRALGTVRRRKNDYLGEGEGLNEI